MIARDDVKLQHLAREPRVLAAGVRGGAAVSRVEVRAEATVTRCDVTEARRAVARRYLGTEAGDRFVADRADTPGDLVQLVPVDPRVWDLTAILPDG